MVRPAAKKTVAAKPSDVAQRRIGTVNQRTATPAKKTSAPAKKAAAVPAQPEFQLTPIWDRMVEQYGSPLDAA